MRIDASDFDDFARELERVAPEVAKGVRPVVQKGALNVKQDWNDAFRESTHFKGIAGSVNYDTKISVDGVEAEIGPDRGKFPGLAGKPKTRPAAPLAGIAHFGGARGGGGSIDDPQKFLDDEAPRFEKALNDLIDEALR